MAFLRRVRTILDLLFHRDAVETELDQEVQEFYRTMVDRYIERGLPEQEARRLARINFGHPESVKEEVRDSRAGAALASTVRNVSYALRSLRKAPLFALLTILMLAVGIGANATIFSVVSRFVLRHPSVGDPARLMALHTTQAGASCCGNFSWPLYTDVRDQAKSFSGVTAYFDLLPASIDGAGEPERVWGQAVTANFFTVAQLAMAVGRGFTPEEEHLPAVVLSHRLWQRRFGADPAIAGKSVRLSGRPYTVVGVAPSGFRGLDIILDAQFWVPLDNIDHLQPNTANRTSRNYHWLAVAGRLAPGVTPPQAAAELQVLGQRFAKTFPDSIPAADRDSGFRMETAGSLPPRDRSTIMMFFAALSAVALLVLCIACANVANLSLAQATGRRREMAVRLALGATHGHLLRQMLTESLLLSLAGGVFGVALSLWATKALAAFRLAAPVPLDLTVSVNSTVLLYAFVLCVGAGILFGLAPAWSVARPVIASTLKGEEPLARAGRLFSLRNLLVISQIAMSLVLLSATGLFLRSLGNASRIDIGFRSKAVLLMSIDPRLHGYSAQRSTQLFDSVRQRVAHLPGVISAAWTDAVPLSGGHRSDGFQVEGKPAPSGTAIVDLYMATPGYFDTMAIPLLAGREFESDSATSPRTAVVNELFAQRFFENTNPLGRHVRDGNRLYEIIGVVKNTKSRTLGEDPRPILYRSLAQDSAADPSMSGYTLLVHYAGDPGPLASAAGAEIHALDRSLAIFNVATMEEHLTDALFLPRLAGTLFGIFGSLGLSLAAVGLYGVISYWVSRRTREIGIRLAIGARAGEVQRLIIRQGMTLALVALIPGLAAAWGFARLFTSFLYGVPAHDAATFTLVPLFLAVVALLACWIPSRRAAKVDPSTALRHE
ncbi:MAG TPA: ABC transporter permease [Candidatus Sulfopaludibacter sp.]|jgi:predicted permease|nr:ABC transporter permease [Candidatus Sulfopaludibacter sp.]